MTAVDSAYIPFPGTTLRHIKPISTTNLVESYDVHVNGCNKVKCPCRVWPQCSYYNKTKWKQSRGEEDENMKTIWEYYNHIFRLTYDMPIANMNG